MCKLNKSIYGLKQAAKNWYEALASLLLKKGFKRSRNDYCLFVRKEEDGTFSYVLVWVDDIVVAGATEEAVNEIQSMLNENFKMDDRGVRNWLLGMQILRSHDKINVDQNKYIETVLQQFNMSDCKAVATPGEVNLKLVKSNEERKLVDPKLYRNLVDSLTVNRNKMVWLAGKLQRGAKIMLGNARTEVTWNAACIVSGVLIEK